MKKLLSTLLIIMLLLTACGTQEAAKTEEEIKAEIRAELEKEQEKQSEANEASLILTGKLMPDEPPFGSGITLDEPLEFEGNVYNSLHFPNKIEKYLSREFFVHDYDFGIIFNDDSNINVKIKVNKQDLGAVDYLRTEEYEIIEVNGDTNLIDRSNDDYSLDIYQQVFYRWCYEGNDGFVPNDVKETYFYKNTDTGIGDIYKNAVDFILASGLYINMGEGEYYINKDDTAYTDGEVSEGIIIDITLDVQEFEELFPTNNKEVKKQENEIYGGMDIITILTYDGLKVYDETPEETGDLYYNESYAITNNNYKVNNNLYIGMDLEDAYNYCKTNYESYTNPHSDTPEKYMFSIPDTDYIIYFNDYRFCEPTNMNETVWQIDIIHYNTTVGV